MARLQRCARREGELRISEKFRGYSSFVFKERETRFRGVGKAGGLRAEMEFPRGIALGRGPADGERRFGGSGARGTSFRERNPPVAFGSEGRRRRCLGGSASRVKRRAWAELSALFGGPL